MPAEALTAVEPDRAKVNVFRNRQTNTGLTAPPDLDG